MGSNGRILVIRVRKVPSCLNELSLCLANLNTFRTTENSEDGYHRMRECSLGEG